MKIRIKFSKTGALKYIGHLDVMRYFQKLNRRANIPVAYSEGFSPHQILSFSPPLPLGAESLGEYADVEITEVISSDEAVKRLNSFTVDGIKIFSFKMLPEKALNAMACVNAARYRCSLKDNSVIDFNLNQAFSELLNQESIIVSKKTKKSEKEVDIKPLIFECFPVSDEIGTFEMLLSSGSVDNLKPELVYKTVFDKYNISSEGNFLNITRMDLYTYNENGELISLDDIGKIIE